ncbi:hypothetical protein CKO25_11405 [Thiocapsa imhoffii]|uniref:CRISPR-associated protein Cas6 C-terminal domain-containing protein n=2 Tax=Thiocapsa imhoffii TaxID=382777 RepID=A0A9X0WI91_9GAMM|nr:hypothetical protein [Thiocapsa imhoffii]
MGDDEGRSGAMTPRAAAGHLPAAFPPLARVRCWFEARELIRFPDYAGSAWRGLLGHGLRKTACVTRQPTCAGCLLIQHCVYSTLFESPDAAGTPGGSPHPFVLEIDPRAPRVLEPGTAFRLDLQVLGAAIQQVPYLIHSFGVAGTRGFGRTGGRFILTAVEREVTLGSENWRTVYDATLGRYDPLENAAPVVPPAPRQVRLQLRTPWRLKRAGQRIGARELSAFDIAHALYRRLRTLAAAHGGEPTHFDHRRLPSDPEALRLTIDWLRWHDWTRYSSRQDALMQLGGLIGEVILDGPALADLWPALWFGQWTHVGQGTAFGLGGYRLASLQESDR